MPRAEDADADEQTVAALIDEMQRCQHLLSSDADAGASWGQALTGCTDGTDFARRVAMRTDALWWWLAAVVGLTAVATVALVEEPRRSGSLISLAAAFVLLLACGIWLGVTTVRRLRENRDRWTCLLQRLEALAGSLESVTIENCTDDAAALSRSTDTLIHVMRSPRSTGELPGTMQRDVGPLRSLADRFANVATRIDGGASAADVPEFSELDDLVDQDVLLVMVDQNNRRTAWGIRSNDGRILGSIRTRKPKTNWFAMEASKRDWSQRGVSVHGGDGQRLFHIAEGTLVGYVRPMELPRDIIGPDNTKCAQVNHGIIRIDNDVVAVEESGQYRAPSGELMATSITVGQRTRSLTFTDEADAVLRSMILAHWAQEPQVRSEGDFVG